MKTEPEMQSLSLDIAGLKSAYAAGRLTPTEVIEAIIARTAEDPNRVWIHRLPDDVLRRRHIGHVADEGAVGLLLGKGRRGRDDAGGE